MHILARHYAKSAYNSRFGKKVTFFRYLDRRKISNFSFFAYFLSFLPCHFYPYRQRVRNAHTVWGFS